LGFSELDNFQITGKPEVETRELPTGKEAASED
jgi:hypothetical protein